MIIVIIYILQVLDRVDMSGTKGLPPNVEATLKIVKSTVTYFFRCIHEKGITAQHNFIACSKINWSQFLPITCRY